MILSNCRISPGAGFSKALSESLSAVCVRRDSPITFYSRSGVVSELAESEIQMPKRPAIVAD